ncbi:MAG: UDP-N-acetylmuramoyl-L-alanyl-D-glutamate--2,6-diaminopimelate ligase [bacterium]|nr:UDP-N-acetylmuramoyl-L-alanyl-D-glutamate--2,6-diaminopimelate ligase [bacterium]
MTRMLSELLAALPETLRVTVSKDAPITAPIVESVDEVEPGGVFVARRGRSVDGHDFIPVAIERGAAAIIGERGMRGLSVPYVHVRDAQQALGWLAAAYYDYPSRKLIVIGVTGTDGKTTTSTLIYSILKEATGGKAGLISTISADLGDTTADTGLHVTTPSAPKIQAFLARMAANGLKYAVIEMTSHGLHQGRLNGVDIDVAVLTNLTHEHLDYHGSFENYRAAKAMMFEMLSTSYRKAGVPKISILNGDDANAGYFAVIPADKRIRYGIENAADYQTRHIDYQYSTESGQHLTLIETTIGRLLTPLLGRFNVYNVLAAAATAHQLGFMSDVQGGLTKVMTIPGRMERIDEGQPFTAIVDFAHTPNALKNALETCRQMLQPGKKLIAVFGSAGLRDVEKRRLMAETSAQLADFTVLTAEDPRTESLDAILQMMAEGCMAQGGVEGETFIRVPDRGDALYRACQRAQPGDIVIACGKGHEQSMAFGTVEYPWDDREGLRTALHGSPLKTLPTAEGA